MSWTKKQLIDQALGELGIAIYTFDVEPEQYDFALMSLDSMIATWNGVGIRLSYPLHSSQADSSLDEDSQLPDYSFEAVFKNLAIRLAPSFGKVVAPELKAAAKIAYDVVASKSALEPPERTITGLPKGQGYKYWRFGDSTMLQDKEDHISDGTSDTIDFN